MYTLFLQGPDGIIGLTRTDDIIDALRKRDLLNWGNHGLGIERPLSKHYTAFVMDGHTDSKVTWERVPVNQRLPYVKGIY